MASHQAGIAVDWSNADDSRDLVAVDGAELPVIQNGDPDEIETFARELLAHAEAERRDR